ncbi:MAG: hypothetical protein BGO31_18795 [Bacteroidetes bacterium 43-16]|nr:MAG: hypothetical protein BGO31_18795 [Bacteroidetes bacterium 43-16]
MKQLFVCFLVANLLGQSLSAQEKIGVYLQAGPYLNLNSYKVTGTGSTHMPAAQLSFGTGIEVDIPVARNFAVIPFVKWHGQKQLVEQNESNGMFTEDSYFRLFNSYSTLNVGAFAQYTMMRKRKLDWHLLAGLSFSRSYSTANGSSYKFTSNMDSAYTILIGSENADDNFDRRANHFNISLGSRIATHIKKLGDFKFGLVVFAPLGRMPEVAYSSEFITSGQSLYTHTYTRNRQFNAEVSILYRLFGWRAF